MQLERLQGTWSEKFDEYLWILDIECRKLYVGADAMSGSLKRQESLLIMSSFNQNWTSSNKVSSNKRLDWEKFLNLTSAKLKKPRKSKKTSSINHTAQFNERLMNDAHNFMALEDLFIENQS
jgi:hypothetical protein